MEGQTIEVVIERTSRSFYPTDSNIPSYGVARLGGYGADNFGRKGSGHALVKLEDPLRSEVVLRERDCVPIPQSLGGDEALLAPLLALALSFWDRLHLELGEAAIYAEGDFFSDLVGQVAIWCGGCPVIRLCNSLDKTLLISVESQCMEDPDAAVHQLRDRIKEKPGVAAVDLSGRPETIDLLLEVMPRWGRLLLAGQARQSLTVDFYNNVHRKGVLLISTVLDPTCALNDGVCGAYLPAAFRLLQNKDMAAACLGLVRGANIR